MSFETIYPVVQDYTCNSVHCTCTKYNVHTSCDVCIGYAKRQGPVKMMLKLCIVFFV